MRTAGRDALCLDHFLIEMNVTRNRFDVAMVGAATPPNHSQRRELRYHLAITRSERFRIAIIELGHHIEFGVGQRGRVCLDPADPREPWR